MRLATQDLLRLATIGSVDDGKSTLIGRLLVDTRQLFDDQLDAVVLASERRGVGDLDLSFVTDGLRAEREQGITIDVAYRYAATPTRKFIIADCPGHVQYTRNMATGASTADLALVVLDVAHGLKEQTRRHLCIAALLGVRTLIVAANKMDQVNWSPTAYRAAVDQVETLAAELGFADVTVIPVSALLGDNVVDASEATPWYEGPSVLDALEASSAGTWTATGHGARLPIQWVLRQPGGGRTYAGMVSADALRVGDAVTLLPAGVATTVTEIRTGRGPVAEAGVGLSVAVALADETDAGRGDMLAVAPLPRATSEVTATICWFGEQPLVPGRRLRLKHTTKVTPARVTTLQGVVDVATLEVLDTDELTTNQIGLATIHTADTIVVDEYRENRVTGSFVLIDEVTNATVAAGMVGRAAFLAAPAGGAAT
ncbi:MAG: sulfate adenylyltransferase [Acidobacteriota bacterium]|nr:sulfate adenylyltransferase [Acidobacteriota bacterium]